MSRSPLEALSFVIEECLPGLAPEVRELLRQLVHSRGYPPRADDLARSLGLRNRHQLAYLIRREGLLPLRSLERWIRIMVWLAEHESGGSSLCGSTLQQLGDPSYRYRMIKEVLGIEWSVLEKRGFTWLLLEFFWTCAQGRARSADSVAVQRLAELAASA
jgi:hypothetical protein